VKEQWIGINFCFKLIKTAVEIHKMLKKAFGDNGLSQTQTYKWFKCFTMDGCQSLMTSVLDDLRPEQ
jgi:hypothetical protein